MVNINKEEVQHVIEYAEAATFYISLFIFFLRLETKVLACSESCFPGNCFKIDIYQLQQYPFRPAGPNAMAIIISINF